LGVSRETDHNLIDLDTERFFDQIDLVEFTSAALCQARAARGAWEAYAADPALARRLATAIADRAGRNYLVAALAADPLAARQKEVLDPAVPGFDRATLPASVSEALKKFLDQLESVDRENVRDLLTALAFGRGNGVTDDLWRRFAAALGFAATAAHLGVLRHGAAADYLLQSSTVEGERVTRLFHQALVEELQADRQASRRADELKILATITPAAPTTWLSATAYAKMFAAEHAVAADKLCALLDDPD
jgi:hypothetical protein